MWKYPRSSAPTHPKVRDFLAEEADGEEEDEDAVAVHDGRCNEHRGVGERGQGMEGILWRCRGVGRWGKARQKSDVLFIPDGLERTGDRAHDCLTEERVEICHVHGL